MQLKPVVSSKLVQGSIALIILAAVDAAFSGDWSRIGAITKDQEAWLQSAVKALGVWHVLNGAAAFVIADQNGKPKVPTTLKVLAIGTVPLLELILYVQTEEAA